MFALRFNTAIQKYVNSAFIIIIITIVKTINNTIMILKTHLYSAIRS